MTRLPPDHAQRVIAVARSAACSSGQVSLLSIEDCGTTFVLRPALAGVPTDTMRNMGDFASFRFAGRDDSGQPSQGLVSSAFRTPDGFDLAVSFTPGLAPTATWIELSLLRPAPGWRQAVRLEADEHPMGGSPVIEPRLSPDTRRVLDVAHTVATEAGLPLGYEQLLIGVTRMARWSGAHRALNALALTAERTESAVATVGVLSDPPADPGATVAAGARQAARHGACEVGPEHFFEAIIRNNLDLGRLDRVSLLFPTRFQRNRRPPALGYKTRVITRGVAPSLHVDTSTATSSSISRRSGPCAPRRRSTTRATFSAPKAWTPCPPLRAVGRRINAKLLEAEQLADGITPDAWVFERLQQPTHSATGQRVSALRFGDQRVQALFGALCRFGHLPDGLRHRALACSGRGPAARTSAR
ncbi:MAG: hypothetical protein JO023_15030 [Chloroflexi bacterium]|nr:hypothetical protein [Chloroflexota bacterium]